jgi:hypothetical protein
MPSLAFPWPRSQRRAASRVESRKYAHYNGQPPRYEPARDLSCSLHHRQLPCKRCAGATS